eukprot:2651250-Pyramimonas_sp.AAC.1
MGTIDLEADSLESIISVPEVPSSSMDFDTAEYAEAYAAWKARQEQNVHGDDVMPHKPKTSDYPTSGYDVFKYKAALAAYYHIEGQMDRPNGSIFIRPKPTDFLDKNAASGSSGSGLGANGQPSSSGPPIADSAA